MLNVQSAIEFQEYSRICDIFIMPLLLWNKSWSVFNATQSTQQQKRVVEKDKERKKREEENRKFSQWDTDYN